MKIKGIFLFFAFSLLLTVACGGKNKEEKEINISKKNKEEVVNEIKPDESEKIKFRIVNLYFYNPSSNSLQVEKRQVFDLKEETSMIKQVLRSLKLGPVSDLKPSVPENIEFKDVFVFDDKVCIDLHKTSDNSYIGGVEGEEMFIEAVVKTVLDINPKYKKVVFLIDGEQIESVLGHIDCSGYFSKDSF